MNASGPSPPPSDAQQPHAGIVRSGSEAPPHRAILGMRVDATTYTDAIQRIVAWAHGSECRTVGVATVNNVMEAYDDPSYRSVMNRCDLVTSDGQPLVWGLKLLGVKGATRVYGPELTPRLLAYAADEGLSIGFYGGSPEVIDALCAVTAERWPSLRIGYAYSPPFRPLDDVEDDEVVEAIVSSGIRVLFVGLGCPKQERWMDAHRDRLPIVQIGVGAAFDFLAGRKRQAPAMMQSAGLEWLFRLATEPRRLWKRYLHHNPRFVMMFGAQVLRARFGLIAATDDDEDADRIHDSYRVLPGASAGGER
jgi:N-acetylglucosaminyldiphosphoundecaprenol N-acetyl-beta-D-mannosaminyltransferase